MSKKKKDTLKLDRDRNCCRKCGATPELNKWVDLHLHHIKPFSNKGATHEDNLITLCQICHRELKPHWDESLFDILENQTSGCDEGIKYLKGVRRYQNALQTEFEMRDNK